jgi:hypothetical protein
MFSTHDLNQNVILFVGRPTDSKKGLGLLFEAIEILTTLADLPKFSFWILGGSPREITILSKMIDRVSSLRSLLKDGRISLWGRVENEALSEFYSRALVTVVPSYREEFGIVAVEAMMSGCPVIASRTGGLEDIVRSGETGILFEPDNTLALTAALCSYLRNPELREIHGSAGRKRATALFSQQATLSQITKAYQPSAFPDKDSRPEEDDSLDRVLNGERLERLRSIFNEEDIHISSIKDGHHPVFVVQNGSQKFVAKFFLKRTSGQQSLMSSPPGLSLKRGANISYNRVLYNKENPISPPIHYFDEEPEPLIISKWMPPADFVTETEQDNGIREAATRCQQYKKLSDPNELLEYFASLERFIKRPDKKNLKEFDLAVADLNSRMTGGVRLLCRCHPQIELLRYREGLRKKLWPLPPEFAVRSLQLTDFLLGSREIVIEAPLLAHADPKPEHLLLGSKNEILLTDFEHSRYAVGPLDISFWLTISGIRGNPDCSAEDICTRLCNVIESDLERYLSACWIASEVIFFTLLLFSRGDYREIRVAQNFMKDFGLVLLNKGIIR